MKDTFRHRKAIAKLTLLSVFIVLLLAFNFTVFAVPCYAGSFEHNIMLTADNIGHSVLSSESGLVNARGHDGSGGIVPPNTPCLALPAALPAFHVFISLMPETGIFSADAGGSPVSLRTRLDQ